MNRRNGSLRQRGVSLIEVLVALLVLGIGVMGYAALQLRSVKMSEDTYSRSQAMAIAQDTVERIRANIDGLASYTAADWAITNMAAPAQTCTATNALAPPGCSAADMAENDIQQIKTTVRDMLPTGSVTVLPCDKLTCVIVAWNDTVAALPGGADSTNCQQTDIDDGDRGNAGSCVVLEFIP